jgi:predicted transcriptional regulator
MEESKPIGSINRLEIVKAISEMKYNEKLQNLAKQDITCLDGEAQIGTVLETLASDDERIFPVMDKDQFSGVINFNHIIEYLLLHKAVTREYGRMKSLIGLLH